ncbi:hypothetical protein Deia_00512 [Candidatus Deianiraea vastatrix]|uniref:GtrA-like protein n=1 Tax=Candidatus Deianiraea vastatrix TaxID=2163644 RepID=A0A5B8XD53_9RICK|nr:hypothetical protein Deia_00512 [Candidatus Deianiraea vastatrix]
MKSEKIRFIIGGAFNSFCNVLIFNVIYFSKLTLNIDLIFYISSLLSILISIFVIRFFVFRKHFEIFALCKIFITQIFIMFIGSYLFDMFLVSVKNPSISQICSIIICAFLSFFINRFINK